jgi:outer membrane receptor for ferrienterochelin and colicins
MNKKVLFLFILLFSIKLMAQSLSGYIISYDSSPLNGATIIIKELSKGAVSLENGYFEINEIPAGSYTIEITYVGYRKEIRKITIGTKREEIKIFMHEDAITTNQVVVSASKHEEIISELPVSAMLLLPESIEKKNIITLDEALRHIPGVHINLDQISIRGSSGYSKGAGTRVLTAIDGVPIMVPISNIERVEIIKGPASSLYGSTAIGGVINVITKKIYNKPITQFSTLAGFYSNPYHDEWKWSGKTRSFYSIGINHSNTIGNLGYSFNLRKIDNDSYRENDFSKRILAFTKLDYTIDSLNSVSCFVNYLNMNRGNFLYWKDDSNALIPKDEDNGKIVKSDRVFGSLIYRHKFSNDFSGEIKSSIYNSKFEGIGVEVTASQSNLVRSEVLTHAKLNSAYALTSGIEFSHSTISSNLFKGKEFTTFSAYSQIEFKGIQNLTAALGLRYDYIKLDSLSGANAINPKIGINFKLNDKIIIRSSFGTGFRAPTPAEVFTSTNVGSIPIKENPELTFEKSFSFDAGILWRPDNNFSLDFSVFHNEYDNFIEPVLLKTGYIQFINLPKARIQGFELLIENYFIDRIIKTSTGYTYLWSRDIENNSPMKYRPVHTINSSISFSPFPLEFIIDFRYMSRVERIDDDLTRPPLTLVPGGEKRVDVIVFDAAAGYNFSVGLMPIRIFLNCKNLFNYNYVEFIGNVAPIRNFSLSFDLFF